MKLIKKNLVLDKKDKNQNNLEAFDFKCHFFI